MNTKPAKSWNRLDNAAKIFPPTTTRRDPKVFRFSCRFTEEVDPEVLQKALQLFYQKLMHLLYYFLYNYLLVLIKVLSLLYLDYILQQLMYLSYFHFFL